MSSVREIRFGIRRGDRYSQYWTLRAAAAGPDVYLASQRTGRFMHISVHDPAYGVHVKVKGPEGEAAQVARYPDPLTDGVARLLQVRIPPAAATYGLARQDVHWVEAPVDPDRWIAFEIIAEDPGAIVRQAEWDRGCVLVGRVPTADGGSLALAAWQMQGEAGSWTLPASDAQKKRVREAVAVGAARVLIQGINPDGSLWFLELAGEGQIQP